jgi:23S rRNA pseudouridine2605 synthase
MSAVSLVAFLARAGLGSRRRCDELVRQGRVTVNGEIVTFPRTQVAEADVVAIDGEHVVPQALRYVLVNKPRGVASTRSDPHAEHVLVDLVPDGRRLFPVGRLDVDTSGLIVLTNDGPLANRLMHPRYGVPKTYVVRVRGRVTRRALAQLRAGIELEDGVTAPAEARLLKQSAKTALVEVVLHEGRKRQVRRMFAALELPVEELHRRRYGPLTDKDLKIGQFRELSADEVDALRRAAELVDESIRSEPEEQPVSLSAELEQPTDGRQSALAEVASAEQQPAEGRALANGQVTDEQTPQEGAN